MPLLALLLAAQDEARLDVRATFERPHATYAEIGAWVQQRSGVPVYVVPAVWERKATVLVRDRPLRETMDRVAEALFLRWERTKDGYTLGLAEGVPFEEARIAGTDASATRQGAIDGLNRIASYARYTPETLQGAIEAAKTERDVAKRDPSEAGKAAAAAADRRANELSTYGYAKHYQVGATILRQLSPAQRAAIVDGATAVASNRPGFLRIDPSVAELTANSHGPAKAGERVMVAVRYDPKEGAVEFAESRWSEGTGGGSSMVLKGSDEASYRDALRKEPLQKRLREWATTDAATLATPLRPAKPETGVRATPYRTLAELLTGLHERTGLPIVADGFRLAVVAKRPPDGATLELWNRALAPWTDQRFRGYHPLLRTSGGWAMFRHPQYWKWTPREAPESAIAALEAAWRRPERATLDDYAAFAGRLTPVQAAWVGKTSPVMDVPGDPLDGSMPFLRLWSALGTGARRSATEPNGLSVRALNPTQRGLFAACFDGKRGSIFDGDDVISYWLPNGPPLPADLRLFVNLRATAMPADWVDPDYSKGGQGYSSERDSVPAVYASLGTLDKRGMAGFSVPLRGPTH